MSRKKHYECVNPTEDNVTKDVKEVYNEPVVEDVPVVEPEVVEAPKPIIGSVSGCAKLNVRERPNVNAAIVGEITNSTEVEINEDESTEEFYKVCTAFGIEGFCMRKFIVIPS